MQNGPKTQEVSQQSKRKRIVAERAEFDRRIREIGDKRATIKLRLKALSAEINNLKAQRADLRGEFLELGRRKWEVMLEKNGREM